MNNHVNKGPPKKQRTTFHTISPYNLTITPPTHFHTPTIQPVFFLSSFNADNTKLHHYIRQRTTTFRYQQAEGGLNMVVARALSNLRAKGFE